MLSEKDVASAKTTCKRPAPTAGDGEAAKAIEKPQSSMINSDHRKFIVMKKLIFVLLISAGLFAAGGKEAAALKTAYDGKDAKSCYGLGPFF